MSYLSSVALNNPMPNVNAQDCAMKYVDRYRVNTINIPMTSTQGNHTFNVIDVEIYAVFSILWLLLFLVSMFACWRLHITLEFFRVQCFCYLYQDRKIANVILLCKFRISEQWFCWLLYLYLRYFIIGYFAQYCGQIQWRILLNQAFISMFGVVISLLFSLCAYYNKHFHRDGFLRMY